MARWTQMDNVKKNYPTTNKVCGGIINWVATSQNMTELQTVKALIRLLLQSDLGLHCWSKTKPPYQPYINPFSANHDCSKRQIFHHLSKFLKKIRYDIS